jgi:hypothetical protein
MYIYIYIYVYVYGYLPVLYDEISSIMPPFCNRCVSGTGKKRCSGARDQMQHALDCNLVDSSTGGELR